MISTPRPGPRPSLSDEGPQRQLTDRAAPELWGRLVAHAFSLPGVRESHSQVSPASSRGLFLRDLETPIVPWTSLAPEGRLEPVHLHGVDDTSVHLCLPVARGAELTALGWATPHQYEDFGTEILVYGPRDEAEVDVVVGLIEEAIAFARDPGDEQPAHLPVAAS
ncbi:luciferase family protein [Clavibacter zhangzhiyongii]|uniref:luciferase domain-containing protein n=1 Tax=Clavibacter zhangzhiyongii TaxID=2768071 RepID=UPI0039E1D286